MIFAENNGMKPDISGRLTDPNLSSTGLQGSPFDVRCLKSLVLGHFRSSMHQKSHPQLPMSFSEKKQLARNGIRESVSRTSASRLSRSTGKMVVYVCPCPHPPPVDKTMMARYNKLERQLRDNWASLHDADATLKETKASASTEVGSMEALKAAQEKEVQDASELEEAQNAQVHEWLAKTLHDQSSSSGSAKVVGSQLHCTQLTQREHLCHGGFNPAPSGHAPRAADVLGAGGSCAGGGERLDWAEAGHEVWGWKNFVPVCLKLGEWQ
eukprot:s4707_g3.t1